MSGKATLLDSLFSFPQGYLRNLAIPKETPETFVPILNLEPQIQSKHRLATEEPSCLPPCIRAKSSITNSLPLLFAPIPDTIKMPKMEKTVLRMIPMKQRVEPISLKHQSRPKKTRASV